MDSHKGMSASGKLYGFLPDFTTDDEDCVFAEDELNGVALDNRAMADEDCTKLAESLIELICDVVCC